MRDMISVASGFQYSVNIGYDLGSDNKLKSFIPTKSALSLLEDILLSVNPTSSDRARVLIGAYGKGKSHIVLTILSILMKRDLTLFEKLMPKIEENPRLYQLIQNYYESENKILPVVISGSNTSLTQAFLLSLQRTLSEHDLLSAMPETNYKAAISVIKRWQKDFPRRAAVDALALEQPLLDDLLLHLVQAHVDLDIPVLGVLLAELLFEVDDSLGQTGLADVLVVGVECVGDLVQTVLAQIVEHIVVDGSLFKRELRLADGVNDGVDELHDLDVRLMGQLDALHEDVFLDLVGLRLDHDDLLVGRRDGHKALAGVALILRGVDDILAIQIADIGGRGRAVPGNVGIGDDERRADGGDDLNGVIVVLREDGVGQNDVVAQLFVEQGAHRAVDEAGDQHAAVGGLALAAVERAAGVPRLTVKPLLPHDLCIVK